MTYRLHGALGSPYSVKMRALMRYRRIPFVWVQDFAARQGLFAQVKAPVIPLLEWPDGRVANDSTLLVQALEAAHSGRSVVPDDAADAFLAFLIEDFADEWGTKAMFAYRWMRTEDQQQMSRWLAFDSMPGAGRAAQERFAGSFRERQVGRMAMVGCTPENDALIVESTRRMLGALEAHCSDSLFLFGGRPSLAEFSLFGQISQLATDPTPQAMMRADFSYAMRWLMQIDDLSGHEGEWGLRSPAVAALLGLIGEVYLPFLVANAAAVEAGADRMEFAAMGHGYAQPPFRYQVKCLAALRAAWAALPAEARASVAALLAETGCLLHLEEDI